MPNEERDAAGAKAIDKTPYKAIYREQAESYEDGFVTGFDEGWDAATDQFVQRLDKEFPGSEILPEVLEAIAAEMKGEKDAE